MPLAEQVKDNIERVRRQAAQAVEDGIDAAGRSLRKTRNALADAQDEAIYRVKRRPVVSVAAAFGVGALIGIVVGLLSRERNA